MSVYYYQWEYFLFEVERPVTWQKKQQDFLVQQLWLKVEVERRTKLGALSSCELQRRVFEVYPKQLVERKFS